MALIESIIARAQSNKQRIVLPESLEERTITAADKALADNLADIILIGAEAEIKALASKLGLKNIDKATIIDPATSEKTEEYAQLLFELRKKKGMTIEEARKKVLDPLYFGCLIIKSGDADGQISGALSTTGDTLRPALQIIKCAPGISCVSGAMLLITKANEFGEEGVVVMGDVAVTPMPDANQLAQIAVCTAQTAKSVAGFADPRVAMLSFSTKGSAKHEVVDKVVEATKLAKELENCGAKDVLLICAENGNANIDCDKLPIYKTGPDFGKKELLNVTASDMDYIIFSSGSAAQAYSEMTDGKTNAKFISIGAATTKAAKECGIEIYKTAKISDAECIAETILGDIEK